MKKILIVDDEPNIVMALEYTFKKNNFEVFIARDGQEALDILKTNFPDMIILDVMMPMVDGYATLEQIRKDDNLKHTKVIFLSAKNKESDIEKGIALGADAYLTKPFSMEELIARIEAISRRSSVKNHTEDSKIKIGAIVFDAQSRMLYLPTGVVKLTTKENQLLSLLTKNTNEVIDRQATLRAIWGDDNYFNGRSMDVYIAKLRKLLKEDSTIEIMNIHGKGFQLIVK